MGNFINQLKSYLNYKLSAKNLHHLHSPFAFELTKDVLYNRQYYPAYQRVNKIRKQLQNNLSVIEVHDFGAGAGKRKYTEMLKSIASVYKNNSIRPKYGELLYRLVDHFHPDYMLELGTSLGISTAYQALAAPNATFITAEGCAGLAEKANENFQQLKLKNIKIEIGNFDILLKSILEGLPQIDFAFIDGNHRKDPTIQYFELCRKKSHNDTVLIFDDIHWSPDMNEAWDFISQHESVTLSLDLFQIGIIFFKKELSKENFVIQY
jgi:predicted O-methyltransferase YrrM